LAYLFKQLTEEQKRQKLAQKLIKLIDQRKIEKFEEGLKELNDASKLKIKYNNFYNCCL
jgi:hypothetical protein